MAARKSKSRKRNAKQKLNRRRQQVGQRQGTPSMAPTALPSDPAPRPAEGECEADRAILSNEVRSRLPEDARLEAEAVLDALKLLASGQDEAALQRLSGIPRRSPYAEWRLFARGLVSYYLGDLSSAGESWQRLDAGRRPWRIASTLLAADDAPPLAAPTSAPAAAFQPAAGTVESSSQPAASRVTRIDQPVGGPPSSGLVEAARQRRRREQVLDAAREIATVPRRSRQASFSWQQTQRLLHLRERYRRLDPDFVDAFSRACVRVAADQPSATEVEELMRRVPGPDTDPEWRLLRYHYWMRFEDAEQEVQQAVESMAKSAALPRGWSEDFKNAVLSLMFQRLALVTAHSVPPFIGYLLGREAVKEEMTFLERAVAHWPANQDAQRRLITLLEQEREGRYKAQQDEIIDRLIVARKAIADAAPEDVPSRLWLVEQYLERGQFAEAEAIVSELQNRRLSDPQARALPWLVNVRQAMSSARLKRELPDARRALATAEQHWPSWFNCDWQPLLAAAIEARAGDLEAFLRRRDSLRRQFGWSQPLTSLIGFAALQLMHLSAPDLKEHRQSLEAELDAASSLPLLEHLRLAAFLWDLRRTGLRHGGYRAQAARLGKGLCLRLERAQLNDPAPEFQGVLDDAVDWIVEHSAWMSGRDLPDWLKARAVRRPRAAASVVAWYLEHHPRWTDHWEPIADFLNRCLNQQFDAFYRYRLDRIAREAQETLERLNEERSRWARTAPSWDFTWDDDDDEIYYEVDDDDDDDDDDADEYKRFF